VSLSVGLKMVPIKSRSDSKKELYMLAIARSDLSEALAGCDLLINNRQDVGVELYQSLFQSIIISYARPFKTNRPYGRLSTGWSNFSSPNENNLHGEIISARDQFVAHSDEEKRKVYIHGAGSAIFQTGKTASKLSISTNNYVFPVEKISQIKHLCSSLGLRINQRVKQLTAELYAGKQLPSSELLLEINDDL
jgi:hypothetical protein